MWGWLLQFTFFTLLGEYFRPKPHINRPASAGLKDLSFPTADPTRPVPWLVGQQLLDAPNLFCTYDFRAQERSRSQRTGLFSKTDMPLPTEYYISAGMTLCGGSGAVLKEIWVEDVRVWSGSVSSGGSVAIDYSTNDGGSEDNPVGIRGTLDFHSGSSTPNAYLASKRGAGNCPAWPHLTYVVLRGTGGGGAWIGTSTQVKHIKFVVQRMPSAASTGATGGAGWAVGSDANPAYAIAELLTDPYYCAGMPPAQLDYPSIHAAATVLLAENHAVSLLWDSQRSSGDVAVEVCGQIGAIIQPNPATGLQTLRLLRATDAPVFTLNDDNIKVLSSFSRSALDEATNAMALQYTSKADKWEKRPVEVQDLAAIEIAGQVITSTASYAGLMNAATAGAVGMRDLRAVSAPLATVRVSAIVPKKQKFMPGDTVAFSSEKNGIAYLRMRVTSARYSQPGQALCELGLLEDVFFSGAAIYTPPAPTADAGAALPPGRVGWELYDVQAIGPLTPDPSSVHMMYFAGAPASLPENATGYRLAYFDDKATRSAATATWAERTTRFAARGQPTSGVGVAELGVFQMTVSASDAYTISKNAGVPCLAVRNTGDTPEFLRVSATVAGLVATVTVLERGAFGTLGASEIEPTSAYCYLLYDYAVDPSPLPTAENVEQWGSGPVEATADSAVAARTVGPAGYGPFDSWVQGARSPRLNFVPAGEWAMSGPGVPYGPGLVRAGSTPLPEWYGPGAAALYPTVAGSALAWTGRDSTAAGWEGYLSGTGWEPGTAVAARVYWLEAGSPAVQIGYSAAAPAGVAFDRALITGTGLKTCQLVLTVNSPGRRGYGFAFGFNVLK